MNKEQLLEAIGNVEENLLLEAEKVPRRTTGVGRIALIAAIVAALAITAGASTGLFSRPIKDHEILEDVTVAPFDMDANGNILLDGASGMKVTMEVEFDPDAPTCIQDIYYLTLDDTWQFAGGGGGGDGYEFYGMQTNWEMEGKPGQVRLHQNVASYYTQNSEHCVGVLEDLTADDDVISEITDMAGLQVLKVTIPALEAYDGIQYCPDGETRLYWADGKYILELDYPYWISDQEAEKLLQSLSTKPYTPPYPENYGQIDPAVIEQMKPGFSISADNTGTTMANSVMSWGRFAYDDGSIYIGEAGKITRYDMQTGETETYALSDPYNDPTMLFCTDAYVCYVDAWSKLIAVNKETGVEQTLYDGVYSAELYADGMTLYTRDAVIDLLTGKISQYPQTVVAYYADDTYIYATPDDGGHYFLRSLKTSLDFEKIQLDFFPIKVLADGEDIYFCEGGESKSYQLIRYRDGVQTRLPVYAVDYQLLDGRVIYLDRDGRTLNSYNLETGETTQLYTDVFDFSILEDRYICMELYNEDPVILDWDTAQLLTVK